MLTPLRLYWPPQFKILENTLYTMLQWCNVWKNFKLATVINFRVYWSLLLSRLDRWLSLAFFSTKRGQRPKKQRKKSCFLHFKELVTARNKLICFSFIELTALKINNVAQNHDGC